MSTVFGAVPADVQQDLGRLDERMSGVPARGGNNLLIATWNIRAFGDLTKKWAAAAGDSPKRDFHALACIAHIIERFDVVAVQEVKGNIRALRYLLKMLGAHWGFLMTDVTLGTRGNDERLAFLFDTRRLKPSGLAGGLLGLGIKAFSWRPEDDVRATHVEMVTRPGTLDVAEITGARFGGVASSPLRTLLHRRFWVVANPELDDVTCRALALEMTRQRGSWYNWLRYFSHGIDGTLSLVASAGWWGICKSLGRLFGWRYKPVEIRTITRLQLLRREVCSEIVASCYEDIAGIRFDGQEPHTCTPEDLDEATQQPPWRLLLDYRQGESLSVCI